MLNCDPDEMYQVEASSNLPSQITTTIGRASSIFLQNWAKPHLAFIVLYKIAKCDHKDLPKIRSQNAAMKIFDDNQYLWN